MSERGADSDAELPSLRVRRRATEWWKGTKGVREGVRGGELVVLDVLISAVREERGGRLLSNGRAARGHRARRSRDRRDHMRRRRGRRLAPCGSAGGGCEGGRGPGAGGDDEDAR